MKNPSSSGGKSYREGFEANLLAILDACEAKETQDTHDDRLAFLDAVRTASVVPEHGTRPTYKIFEAVFHILRLGKSLELIMASYQLLIELEKRFPRVYLPSEDKFKSSSVTPSELVVVKEAWTPFIFSMEGNVSTVGEAADRQPGELLDSSSFHLLIEELAEMLTEANFQATGVKNMLLLQYLVYVLEGDFLPRNATMKWNVQRESLLNMLLGSRKINYKNLMKDCLHFICQLSQLHVQLNTRLELKDSSETGTSLSNCHTALLIALLEVGTNTCVSMEKFLAMAMELDMSRKKADNEGYTTRADGVRTPLVEIILDELTYSVDTVPLFLQVFNDPKWKLETVVQYLWKYIAKPVRTRRSNSSTHDATFSGALKCFSNNTSTKSIIKKIGPDTVQLLLAHGFQAQLSEGYREDNTAGQAQGKAGNLVDLCKDVITAFDSMRSTHEHMEILSIGKEALFTAATIISVENSSD
ncbi:hypothetical protein L6164_036773 [Bauhinia variegata]|uniref:Uncharacterized protein n=1 Tax=Bauhinia variegata TaxID=167791 RepID=A0ACB9KI34_BAUVA|nr:hypothetical protein L6164_036773 [Bauhinia variegata]